MFHPRPPWVAGGVLGLVVLVAGLASFIRAETLDVAQGADAPSYVRIARTLLATGGVELPGPGVLRESSQERTGDVFGSPWSMTVDGRLLPKHPVLFGATLAPGVAVAGIAGARITALFLGALLAGVATAAAAQRFGPAPAILAGLAIFLLSPAGRNVLWGINVDTLITLLWLGALVLVDAGRPFPAGVLGGLVLFLRPPAILLLGGLFLIVASRPRREILLLAAGLLPPFAALLAVNTAWWGAPWMSAYDRVAVLAAGKLVVETHSGQFTLSPLKGLSILLFHRDGGLFTTAPAGLLGLLGLLLPRGRDRLAVAAASSAAFFLLLISVYAFLARVPETAYRFAMPLLTASVFPLAALMHAALRLRHQPPSQPDANAGV